MATTAADVVVETLIRWNVDTVFGLPGDGINGIMEALRRRQDEIRFIQVRHEESAAFMACAYAKWTGKLGVCLATSGPGGIHLLNGLYDAKMDGAPVLALTGLQFHDLLHTYTQQDVELDKLFIDVAAYNTRVMGPAHVENAMEIACRTALTKRTVSHVTIPVDIQSMVLSADHRSERNVKAHISNVWAEGLPVPPGGLMTRAADILNEGKKVCMLVGSGALGASKEVGEIAGCLAAPVVKALLGKAVLPDRHPHCTGGVGHLGTKPSHEALEACDTLLIVGSTFPYIEHYPKPGKARAVQIDIDPQRIGLRYPVEVGLVGDAAQVLRALLPHIKRRADRSFLEEAQSNVNDWREMLAKAGASREKPMKPQVVTYELNKLIADSAIITTDSGTNTFWTARYIEMRDGGMFACSGNLATMAGGLPYAIAAALAYPDRQVVAVVGDGGLSMLMAELATCARHQLNIKIVVMKNNSLGQIKWEQIAFLGNPEYGCELQPIDFVGVARSCGVKAYAIDDPAACGTTLAAAFAEPGPVLIEAEIDPNEPPMPAHVTFEQTRHFAEAVARGTPNSRKMVRAVAAEKVRELI
jgi:pyruvate dehydrogenase (quinone)